MQRLKPILFTLLLTPLFLTQISFCQAATLSAVEQKLVQQINQDQNQARALLKTVVNINSGSMNFAGVKQVGDIFATELTKLGFTTRWIDGTEFDRAGHLFASREGDPKRLKVLMIGHLDTVFAKDSAIQSYNVVDERWVKGPGIIDMKGGDVIIIYALRALQTAGLLDQLNIQVVMAGDEEKRGHPIPVAAKVLVDSAKWANIALGFENGDGDPTTAVVSRRGYTGWQLVVTGKPAHSSQVFSPEVGDGAIYETARILNTFRTTLSSEPNLTFNPGVMVAGTEAQFDLMTARGNAYGKQNVVAQIARVSGDLRALSPQQQEKAKAAMAKIVAEHLPHTDATLTFEAGYPPMEPTPGNRQLLALYNRASLDLGLGEVTAVDPRKAGAADISFTAQYVSMAIDGLGLMGKDSHTDDEIADMNTLATQTQRTAVLMYRLGQGMGGR